MSIDADVALWLDKRSFDEEPQLPQFMNFVIINSELHNDFDTFKKEFSHYTQRGFSMFPLMPLINCWNEQRVHPSATVSIFHKLYLNLCCTEVDCLCDWVHKTRDAYFQHIRVSFFTTHNHV